MNKKKQPTAAELYELLAKLSTQGQDEFVELCEWDGCQAHPRTQIAKTLHHFRRSLSAISTYLNDALVSADQKQNKRRAVFVIRDALILQKFDAGMKAGEILRDKEVRNAHDSAETGKRLTIAAINSVIYGRSKIRRGR